MKSWMYVLLALIISAILVLGGCASNLSSTVNNPDAREVAANSQDSQKVYEFKFTDQFTPQQNNGILNELLGQMISEKTNGQVKFTFYHSESLGKVSDFLNMLNGGVVDAVSLTPVSFPSQLPMEIGVELPGLGIPNRQVRMDLTWELYNKGYFTGLAPYKVLGFQITPNISTFLKKKVETVAGFKGLKIRCSSNPMTEGVKLFGATPVAVPFSDVYMSIDRGVIDGVMTPYEAYMLAKIYEVAKYAITDPLGSGCLFLIMNKNAWNSIPEDLQVKVDEAIQEYRTAFLDAVKESDETWTEKAAKQGADVYSFSPEEAAKLNEGLKPVKENWIAEHEAKGLPAQEMMDDIANYVAQHQ